MTRWIKGQGLHDRWPFRNKVCRFELVDELFNRQDGALRGRLGFSLLAVVSDDVAT
jgi:hypothetical protein